MPMPGIAVVVVVVFLVRNVVANTNLTGELINDTLVQTDSPYFARQDVIVPTGSTLQIEAGVTVRFSTGKGLHIKGRLLAEGTQADRVKFTFLNETPQVPPELSTTIQLVDGDRNDRGTLQIKVSLNNNTDIWYGLCDERMDYHEKWENAWSRNIAKVACKQMGFANSQHSRLEKVRHFDGPVYRTYVECTGDEETIQECFLSDSYYCDQKEHILGVVCESTSPYNYWSGLVFTGEPHLSNLSFVSIEFAGITYNNESESYDVAGGLVSYESVPVIRDIEITNCASHGVHVIESSPLQMELSNIRAEGNLGHGVLIDNRTVPFSTESGASDFCGNTTYEHYIYPPENYPLKFYYRAIDWQSQSCEHTFTTLGVEHILALGIRSLWGKGHISVMDGADYDDPILWQGTVNFDENTLNYPHFLMSSNNTIRIRTWNYQNDFANMEMFLMSGKRDSFHLALTDISSSNNGMAGIAFSGLEMPTILSDVWLENNANGLLIQNGHSSVTVRNITSQKNKQHGIAVKDTQGSLSLRQSTLRENSGDGLILTVPDEYYSYYYEEISMHVNIDQCIFDKNYGHGTFLESHRSLNVSIDGTIFRSNNISTRIEDDYYTSDSSILKVTNCTYLNNSQGILFKTRRRHVQTIVVTYNTFQNNVAHSSSIVSLEFETDPYYSTSVDISDNIFADNTVFSPESYYVSTLQDLSAVLKIPSGSNINAQRNVFLNNDARFMLSVGRDIWPRLFPSSFEVNAAYCFWGTTEINAISSRIMAKNQRYRLGSVVYFPYLNSPNIYDFDTNGSRLADFVQADVLGGILTYDLTLNRGAYKVISDIIISSDATLEITEGVELEFESASSLAVYGRLRVDGSDGTPVVMRPNQNRVNSSLRLINGQSGKSGFVQIDMGDWYNLCEYDNYYTDHETFEFFCHAMGYSGVKTFYPEYSPDTVSKSVGRITCPNKRLSECSTEESIPFACNASLFFYLECYENHWKGIYFDTVAKESQLYHVNLEHAGVRLLDNYYYGYNADAAVDVEFMQHQFAYVNITQDKYPYSDIAGIRIKRANPVVNYTMVHINIKTNGYGMILHDSRVQIKDSSIQADGNSGAGHSGIATFRYPTHYSSSDNKHIMSICERTSTNLNNSEPLFLRIENCEFNQYQQCKMLLQASVGTRISVQVISGDIQERYNQTEALIFYDGHEHDSDSQNIQPSRNGYLWVSTMNEAQLVMQRSNQYCVYLIIRISATEDAVIIDHDLTIQNVAITNFHYGVWLDKPSSPQILANINVSQCDYGVYIRNDHAQFASISIQNSMFSENVVGFQYYSAYCYYCDSYYYRVELELTTCAFSNNPKVGLIQGSYDYYYDNYGVPSFFKFTGNSVTNDSGGIFTEGNHYSHMFRWAIENNRFDGVSGQVLNLKGSGSLVGNYIQNCRSPNSRLIEFANASESIVITHNQIMENQIGPAVIYLDIKHVDWSVNITPVIGSNVIVDNVPHWSRSTAAIILSGMRQVQVRENVIANPNLEYEIINYLKTTNISTNTDMRFNYWGSENAKDIVSRILDGRRKAFYTLVTYSPFFTNQNLSETSHENEEHDFLKPDNRLGGRLSSDLILSNKSQPYVVETDIIVTPGAVLTLLPGVELKIENECSVIVYGNLQINGTAAEPAVVTRSVNHTSYNTVRLAGSGNPTEGEVYVLNADQTWRPVCASSTSYEFASVVCRELNMGAVIHYSSNYNYGLSNDILPSRQVFYCIGTESSIHECQSYTMDYDCYYHSGGSNYYYYGVFVGCETFRTETRVLLAADYQEPKSVLHNVIFQDISSVEFAGIPPVVENITMTNAFMGMVFLGSSMKNQTDTTVKNVTVKQSAGNGISLYGIPSDITLTNINLVDVSNHGIYIAPTYDSETFSHLGNLFSTFRFCDMSPEQYIRPGEELRFFAYEAQGLAGCRRIFRTDVGQSVHIAMKVNNRYCSYFHMADIYEGEIVDANMKIASFTHSGNCGSEIINASSIGNTMTVALHDQEIYLSYAIVKTQISQDKSLRRIQVSNCLLKRIGGHGIFFENDDKDSRNIVLIERVAIHDKTENRGTTDVSGVDLILKNDKTLICNTDFFNTRNRAIDIKYSGDNDQTYSGTTITHNTISYSAHGGAIYVTNTGTNEVLIDLTKNVIQHNNGGYDERIVQVAKCKLNMKENVLYNNTGRYILELGNAYLHSHFPQEIMDNTFLYNTAPIGGERYTVSMFASSVNLTGNILSNSANTYEVTARPSYNYSYLDCTKNWWGNSDMSVVSEKIRDGRNTQGLPLVDYEPFLQKPPSGLSVSVSCPFGWKASGPDCFLYHGGAVRYAQAVHICQMYKADLLTSKDLKSSIVGDTTVYRSIDGSQKRTTIWTDGNEPGICYLIDPGHADFAPSVVEADSCLNLYPFICKRKTIRGCKHKCYQRGECESQTRTCICYSGWEEDDCSKYHCRDVNNCTGRGDCVGPNICQCDAGWMGRACSVSYCDRYYDCRSCSDKTGCGWCDSSRRCLPGTGDGPYIHPCEKWFYYSCLTTQASQACSWNIAKIECESRYCNFTRPDGEKGLCQQCRDIENCYDDINAQRCFTWSEQKCPKGAVLRCYLDTTRINNAEFKETVHVITPSDTIIYFCPYKLSVNEDTTRQLLITTTDIMLREADILASPQSGGLFHHVTYTSALDGLHFFVASPVGLSDALTYADFKTNLNMQDLEDIDTVEEGVDEGLLWDFLNNNANVTKKIHVFDKHVPLYKCVGHTYKRNGKFLASTVHLVIPISSISEVIEINDIVVSNQTLGYLEEIVSISNTSIGVFAETRLKRCPFDSPDQQEIKLAIGRRDMGCKGGNNWPGLLYWEKTPNGLLSGEIVPGRASGSVIGQVLYKTNTSDFLYIEVVPVDAVDNGDVVVRADTSELTKDRRVPNSLGTHNIFKTSYKPNKFEMAMGNEAWVKPTINLTSDLSMIYTMKWNKMNHDFDFDAGLEFHGSLDIDLQTKLNFSAATEETVYQSVDNINIGRPTPFHFAIAGVPVSCLWSVKIGRHWKTSIQGTDGSLSGLLNGNVGFDVTAATEGIYSSQNAITTGFSKSIDGTVSDNTGNASLTLIFNPAVYVRCPTDPWMLETLPAPLNVVPNRFIDGLDIPMGSDVTKQSQPRVLKGSLEFQFYLETSEKACSSECSDPANPLNQGLSAGLELLRETITINNHDFEQYWPTSEAWGSLSVCKPQTIPCCTCTNPTRPGKEDPITNSCLCQCECNTTSGIIPSVQSSEGNCSCDLCPDGTLRHFGECPCTCSDGTTRTMQSDGSCDCSCDCLDGSTDVLDPKGDCPCRCTCNNCAMSRKGPTGCDCRNDICPVSKHGAKPEWVGCKCRCPDPQCGIPPNCATGRRGNNCDQPDCYPCRGCSGNGPCKTYPGSCRAYCECPFEWRGSCCQMRMPSGGWGDPHLETLDGLKFDYFGIGQFWYCKSEENDFGMQVRYFYYKQTSFTGAVAVKARESVVTLTTTNPATLQDKPTLRIDGQGKPVDTENKLTLSNGTITVDIRPVTQNPENDPGLVLISFEFKTGATLTLDIRYSPQMGRQYVNFMFTPTVRFMNKTSGICGIMDDDKSNDLTGPDQTVHSDTTSFVESWRITPMIRDNAGIYGSWSWTESNFHEDDVVDNSYDDPTYEPSYDLTDFTQSQIDLATGLCQSGGLTGDLLDGCIFDIVITNDTTFAQQESLKIGCPGQCSGKGRCVNETCQCMDTWSGDDCSVGSCGTCYHGDCVSGFCDCAVGWEGVDCSNQATCNDVNNCTDDEHGVCDKLNQCLCHTGYTGEDCSLVATCYKRNNCSGQGDCIDFDVCKCHKGYRGQKCKQFSCEEKDFCSGNGTCVAYDVCTCTSGWTGPSCALPDCSDFDSCSNNGFCEEPNVCSCDPGYTGSACNEILQCQELENCHENGICEKTETTWTCRCFEGFHGEMCEDAVCDLVNNCTGHGQCVEPNLCECDTGYTSSDCNSYSCQALDRCTDHGDCVAYDVCSCSVGWSGGSCNDANCSEVHNCNGQGFCVSPQTCECFDGFEGATCNETLTANLHSPVFSQPVYEATVLEGQTGERTLTTVHATDEDDGRNGEIHYSLDLPDHPLDIDQYILVSNPSGDIVLISAISKNEVPSGTVNITLVAVDGGMPSLFGYAVLILHVEDVNQYCPVFISPKVDEIQHVNGSYLSTDPLFTVLAEDDDVGLNGDVTYTLNTGGDNAYFKIDADSGDVFSDESRAAGIYRIVVRASDTATPPCVTTLNVHVQVVALDAKPATTTEVPTTATEATRDLNMDTTPQTTDSAYTDTAHDSSTDVDSTTMDYPSKRTGSTPTTTHIAATDTTSNIPFTTDFSTDSTTLEASRPPNSAKRISTAIGLVITITVVVIFIL